MYIIKRQRILALRIVTHVVGLIPLCVLVWAILADRLGPDPIGAATRRTGRYALVFLGVSLLPTVIRLAFGFSGVLRVRRALGLYAFMYAALHLLIFVGWDYGFDLALIALVIRDDRRVLLGLASLSILTVMAVTSTNGWARRLGKNWRRLHRLVYLASALAVIHYIWVFKELRVIPVLAGAVLVLLLVARTPPVARFLSRRHQA